jgi:hypothetical protein
MASNDATAIAPNVFLDVDPNVDEPLLRGRHTWVFGPFETEQKAMEWGGQFAQAARAEGLSVKYYHFTPIMGAPKEVLRLVHKPARHSIRGPAVRYPAKRPHPKSPPFIDPDI